MALTAAQRQRRSRAHRAGDHTLCDPAKCDGHTVTSAAAQANPPEEEAPDLGRRGLRLWRDLATEKPFSAAERVLAEEACRLADRLDRLDRILRGDEAEWIRVMLPDSDDELVLMIDRNLAEARQQAIALKTVLAELRMSRAGATPAAQQGGKDAPAAAPAKGGGLLDFAAAVARKRAELNTEAAPTPG